MGDQASIAASSKNRLEKRLPVNQRRLTYSPVLRILVGIDVTLNREIKIFDEEPTTLAINHDEFADEG